MPGLKKGRTVSIGSPSVKVSNHSAWIWNRSVIGTRRITVGAHRLNQPVSHWA